MNFKKFLVCLFAFVMLFSLAGCKKDNGGENGGQNQGQNQGQNEGGNKEEYTITFESNGGSAVAEIKAEKGAAITKPADPTLENMTFGGWYSDIDLLEPYEFPAVMPGENVELFAKWVVTLTFDSKGGPAISPIVGDAGKTYKMPDEPVRDGYVFIGWFTDQNYTNKLSYVMPKANTTAYAKWEVYETGSAITLPLSFTDNDGVYFISEEEGGIKLTATSGKFEWSFCGSSIPLPLGENMTIAVELIGTKDIPVTLKIQDGNAPATETTATMTGEAQTVIWTADEALSTISGSRFLVFLNGGTTGCGETPEYVIIKSVKLYRTVDAEATQKAALHFVVSGGDDIAPIYDVPGAAVTAPTAPEKAGYAFGGWYTDAAFEHEFEFTTMPEAGAMLFAKWDKLVEPKPDIVISLENGAVADDTHIVASYNESLKVLTLSKTAEGSEYEWYALPFPQGADASGYDHLRVSFQGPKGQVMLFKVNDQNGAGEIYVECTGEEQTLDLPFDIKFNMEAAAIVLFPNARVAGASGEFQIYAIQLGNYPAIYDLVKEEGWEAPLGEDGQPNTKTTLEVEDGILSIVKEEGTDEAYNWDCVKYYGEEVLDDFKLLNVIVKGTAGERLLIKVNDQKEFFVDLTGEWQNLYLEYSINYDRNKPALVLFANPNAAGTGHEIQFKRIMFIQSVEEEQPQEQPKEDKDILAGEITGPEGILVDYQLVTSKTGGGQWDWAGLKYDGDLTGYTKMVAEIIGPNGAAFTFKINDKVEKGVTTTGALQEVVHELDASFEWNASAQTMIMFPDFAISGLGNEFTITKLELQGEGKEPINLLACTLSTANEFCSARKDLVLTKLTTNANEYDCVFIDLGEDFTGYEAVKYTVQGTEGEKILLKVNNQNAGEEWVTLGTDPSTGVIDLSGLTFDKGNVTICIFPNVQTAGTEHKFIISELVYVGSKEGGSGQQEQPQEQPKKDMDILAGVVSGSAGILVDYQLVTSKTGGGQWDWAGLKYDGDLTGYTKMVAEIIGPNGAAFTFKINDKVEKGVTTTGALQEVVHELDASFEWSAAAQTMIMFPDFAISGLGNEFTITKLELQGEGKDPINLLACKLTVSNEFCSARKELVLKKLTTDAEEWDCIFIELGEDFTGYKAVKYTVKGTEGEKILLKVNDQNTGEQWITLGTEPSTGVIDLSGLAFYTGNATMVIFPNVQSAGTEHEFVISELVYLVELPE